MGLACVKNSGVASFDNDSFIRNHGSVLSCITILCLSVIGVALAHSIVLGGITGFVIAGIAAFVLLCILSLIVALLIRKYFAKEDSSQLDSSTLTALGKICGHKVKEQIRSVKLNKDDLKMVVEIASSKDVEMTQVMRDSLRSSKMPMDRISDLEGVIELLSSLSVNQKNELRALRWLIDFESRGSSNCIHKGLSKLLSNHLYKDLFDYKLICVSRSMSRSCYENLQLGYNELGSRMFDYRQLSFRLLIAYKLIDTFNLKKGIFFIGNNVTVIDPVALELRSYFEKNRCKKQQLIDLTDPTHYLSPIVDIQIEFLKMRTKGYSEDVLASNIMLFLQSGFSYEQVRMLMNLSDQEVGLCRSVLMRAFFQ